MHDDFAGDGIGSSDRDVLSGQGDDFTAYTDLAVVVGHHRDRIARLTAVGVMGISEPGGLWQCAGRDLQCRGVAISVDVP